MSVLEYYSITDELRMLSSYLELGNKNHAAYKQRLTVKLDENIRKLREAENIHSDVPDDEIIEQVERIVDAMTVLDEFPVDEDRRTELRISGILEGLRNADYYDNTFYGSVVILLYSCIERGLIRYFDIEVSNNNHGVIQQVRDCLSKQDGEKIENQIWKELKFIRWLRNTIVHSGMSFSLDDSMGDIVYESWGEDAIVKAQPELIAYLKANNIYIKEYGQISLNIDYCNSIINFAHNFFNQIDSRMEK